MRLPLLLVLASAACAPPQERDRDRARAAPRSPAATPPSWQVAGSLPHDPPAPNATLIEGGVVGCADPLTWEEVPFEAHPWPTPEATNPRLQGAGMGAGDLDGDGLVDLVLVREQATELFLGSPTGIVPQPDPFPGIDLLKAVGASLADFDGDLDLDIYITRWNEPNVLLRNDGALQFTDVTEATGAHGCENDDLDPCYATSSAAWADYDRDGDLDLLVGNYGPVEFSGAPAAAFDPAHPSILYRNDGGTRFTDVTDALLDFPELHGGYTFVAAFTDFDGDLYPDMLFVNDFGAVHGPNRLVWNQQGSFALDLGASGMDLEMTGMGLASAGDLNGDLVPDVVVPEWRSPSFLVSEASLGLWVRTQAASTGLYYNEPETMGWGAEYADLNLDGRLDLLVAAGHLEAARDNFANPVIQPDLVYINQGGLVFEDQAESLGMDQTFVSRGFVVADLNGDGHLDVFKRDLKGENLAWLSHCTEQAWVLVDLRNPLSMNTHGVGAVVDLWADGVQQRRWVVAGGQNYASSPPPQLHFGLDLADTIERLRVTWPDGAVSEFEQIPSRQRLTVVRVNP